MILKKQSPRKHIKVYGAFCCSRCHYSIRFNLGLRAFEIDKHLLTAFKSESHDDWDLINPNYI